MLTKPLRETVKNRDDVITKPQSVALQQVTALITKVMATTDATPVSLQLCVHQSAVFHSVLPSNQPTIHPYKQQIKVSFVDNNNCWLRLIYRLRGDEEQWSHMLKPCSTTT